MHPIQNSFLPLKLYLLTDFQNFAGLIRTNLAQDADKKQSPHTPVQEKKKSLGKMIIRRQILHISVGFTALN